MTSCRERTTYTASQVHMSVSCYMSQHNEEFANLWGGHVAGSARRAGDAQSYDFHDYLQGIRMNGTFAGYPECYSAAAGLERSLYFLDDDGEVMWFPSESNEAPLTLYFHSRRILIYFSLARHF